MTKEGTWSRRREGKEGTWSRRHIWQGQIPQWFNGVLTPLSLNLLSSYFNLGPLAEPAQCEAESLPKRIDISVVSAPLRESFRRQIIQVLLSL